jgi:mono/diheme cytochrome c family protein
VPVAQTRFDFGYAKLMNPRIYDLGTVAAESPFERLKMPRFGFTSEEAKDLVTFLLALVDDPITDKAKFNPDARQQDILRGRQVVRRYNCQGCHVIEGDGGDIWPAIQNDKSRPPDLLGEGRKVNPDWLFRYLKDPAFVAIPGQEGSDRVRPWHSIRMPTFHLSDEEAQALVRYFAALSDVTADFRTTSDDSLAGADYGTRKTFELKDPDDKDKKYTARVANRVEEARALFQEFQCKSCHAENADPASAAPNFRHTREGRLRVEWIESWLWNPSLLQPGTRMPSFFANESGAIVQDDRFFPGGDPADQAARQIRSLRDYVRYHYREEDR